MRPLDFLGRIKVKLGIVIVLAVVTAFVVNEVGLNSGWSRYIRIAIAVVFALIMVQLLARGMIKPLREMAAAAQTIAKGRYGLRVSATSRDEVGELARAFNAMAADLGEVDRQRRELVANVSHELRTPIAGLQAVLENVADGVTPPDRDTITTALTRTERLGRLVVQLLDLSRLDSGARLIEPEALDLGSLCGQAVREAGLGRDDVTVRCAMPSGIVLDADPALLAQVLANLLDNAVRHSPSGGTVVLGAAVEGADVTITVTDEGLGIQIEDRSRVFERFSRLDGARAADAGGTGLGLAIAKEIVELHGGSIAVGEPVAGAGCRMVVGLPRRVLVTDVPLSVEPADQPPEPAGIPDPAPGEGEPAADPPPPRATEETGLAAAGEPDQSSAEGPDRGPAETEPDRSPAGEPDRAPAGAPDRGTAGAPDRGSAGAPDRGTAGAPDRGPAGAPDRGTAGGPDRGAEGLDRARSYFPEHHAVARARAGLGAGVGMAVGFGLGIVLAFFVSLYVEPGLGVVAILLMSIFGAVTGAVIGAGSGSRVARPTMALASGPMRPVAGESMSEPVREVAVEQVPEPVQAAAAAASQPVDPRVAATIPPGTIPPGVIPPAASPPGTRPPGAIPPGASPPGTRPPDLVPSAPVADLRAQTTIPPGAQVEAPAAAPALAALEALATPAAPQVRPAGPGPAGYTPPPGLPQNRGSRPNAAYVPPPLFPKPVVPPAPAWLLPAVGAAGLVAAVALPYTRHGIGLVITAIAMGAVVVPAALRRGRVTPWTVAFGLLAYAMVGISLIRDATWLVGPLVLAAFGLASLAVSGGRGWVGVVRGGLSVGLALFPLPWFLSPQVKRVMRQRRMLPVLISVAITVLLVVVFGLLFSSADAVFSSLATQLLQAPDWAATLPFRIFVFAVFGALTGAAALVTLRPVTESAGPDVGIRFGRTLWMIPLTGLNLLFASFVIVQITVLFGGNRRVLQTAGLTYAEYARSGFFELVTVSVFVLGLVGLAAGLLRPANRVDRWLMAVLLGLLCAFTLIILASALHRLGLYTDAYGLTRLRASVGATIWWLAAVFVLVVVAGGVRLTQRDAKWLPRTLVLLTGAGLLAFAVWNPDLRVAETQLSIRGVDRLDRFYLGDLGSEAVPALDRLPEPTRSCVLTEVVTTNQLGKPDPWNGWNLARQQARALLKEHPIVGDNRSCGNL
ncbi:DUF4173 domain-containing protein [Streptosporangiaceae bacterium NEAU-GS5]|nr:DUF4173 domain-containing protein [Streptosporangiaceae bacterium NEAU-GS5]